MGGRSSAIQVAAGILLAAVGFETIAYWVGHNISHDMVDVVVSLKQKWIETGRARADIAVFGDSSVKSGIDPRVVARITGRSTINMGTMLIVKLHGHHFMIRRYLKTAGPAAIVLIVDAGSFQRDPTAEAYYYLAKQFVHLDEISHLYGYTHDPSLALTQMFNRTFPFPAFYYRNVIRRALLRAVQTTLQGDLPSLRHLGSPVREATRIFEERDGLFPLEGASFTFKPDEEWDHYGEFSVSEEMVAELQSLVETVRHRQVPLFLGLSPVPASVGRWWEKKGYEARVDRLASELKESNPQLRLLDPFHPVYPDSDFFDRRHINERVIRRHSAWLGEQIRGFLQPGS